MSDSSPVGVVVGVGGVASSLPPSIPDHELIRRIGTGSYGEVWLARSAVGTYRAAKIVYRHSFENEKPFEREFSGIQKFEPISRSHEGLVDVLQIGRNEKDGYFYYIMELADAAEGMEKEEGRMKKPEGSQSAASHSSFSLLHSALEHYAPRTLRAEQRRQGRLPLDECVSIGLTLASALEHLHTSGLVHRDIKPSNIIFVSGVPKLADIGLVADTSEAKSFVGTVGFIPPEGPGTPQADLYSLGKVLYEISTGKDRQDFPQLPADLRELPTADAMIEFNEVLLKACEAEPRRRYQSAGEIGADLELLQTGQSVRRKHAQQRRWAVCQKASLAIGLLALVAAAILFFVRGHGDGELHSVNPEADKLVKYADHISADNAPDRLAKAVDQYKQAIRLDPKFAPAYIGLFSIRLLQYNASDERSAENLRAAATDLTKFAPSLAEGRLAAAQLKWIHGFQDEALAEAEKATRMPASSKEGRGFVHEVYGCMLLMTGDQVHSFQQYLLAEKDNVADPTIQVQLANHYFVEHDFKKALEHFDRSIELQPNISGYHGRGHIYEEQREFLRAIQEFQRGDQLDGKNEAETKPFYNELREAFNRDGPTGYWQKRFDKESAASPPDAQYIATILAHQGKMDEAYRWLRKACNEGKLQGLWWDACWDHSDERFKEIAKMARRRR